MPRPAAFLYAAIALAGAVLVVAVLSAAKPARAHDWYPLECCHSMDCAPVDKVEIVPSSVMASMLVPPAHAAPSVMIVTTMHGTVAVPANFQQRQSKDGRMHACIRGGKLICIFLPPAM